MIHLMAATLPQQSTGPTIVRNCGSSVASETTDSAKVVLAEPLFGSITPYHQDSLEGSGARKGSSELGSTEKHEFVMNNNLFSKGTPK